MPRAGLSYASVVSEAAREADERGIENVTMADIARHFGVAVPSLYKHVRGLDDVRRGVATMALRELGQEMSDAIRGIDAGIADEGGDARLRAMARAYRAYAIAHPGLYAASLRAPVPEDVEHAEASSTLLTIVFDVLAERGLAGDAAIDATRALRAALHGFVSLEAAGGFGMPRGIEQSFARLLSVIDLGLAGDALSPRADA